jgi:hypothetical protein
MIIEDNKREEILLRAKKLLHYNNLLLNQCDRWLPEEEGNKNMMTRIMQQKHTKKTKKHYHEQ